MICKAARQKRTRESAAAVLIVLVASVCLRRLGSTRGWTVSSLGTVVATFVVLAFFLRSAATGWSLVLPVLAALAFLAADRVLEFAEHVEERHA